MEFWIIFVMMVKGNDATRRVVVARHQEGNRLDGEGKDIVSTGHQKKGE